MSKDLSILATFPSPILPLFSFTSLWAYSRIFEYIHSRHTLRSAVWFPYFETNTVLYDTEIFSEMLRSRACHPCIVAGFINKHWYMMSTVLRTEELCLKKLGHEVCFFSATTQIDMIPEWRHHGIILFLPTSSISSSGKGNLSCRDPIVSALLLGGESLWAEHLTQML